MANTLNHLFHSCFNTIISPRSSEEGSSCELDPAACLQQVHCSWQEAFENVDIKKATGPDGISARMLKELLSVLSLLKQCSLTSLYKLVSYL